MAIQDVISSGFNIDALKPVIMIIGKILNIQI